MCTVHTTNIFIATLFKIYTHFRPAGISLWVVANHRRHPHGQNPFHHTQLLLKPCCHFSIHSAADCNECWVAFCSWSFNWFRISLFTCIESSKFLFRIAISSWFSNTRTCKRLFSSSAIFNSIFVCETSSVSFVSFNAWKNCKSLQFCGAERHASHSHWSAGVARWWGDGGLLRCVPCGCGCGGLRYGDIGMLTWCSNLFDWSVRVDNCNRWLTERILVDEERTLDKWRGNWEDWSKWSVDFVDDRRCILSKSVVNDCRCCENFVSIVWVGMDKIAYYSDLKKRRINPE